MRGYSIPNPAITAGSYRLHPSNYCTQAASPRSVNVLPAAGRNSQLYLPSSRHQYRHTERTCAADLAVGLGCANRWQFTQDNRRTPLSFESTFLIVYQKPPFPRTSLKARLDSRQPAT